MSEVIYPRGERMKAVPKDGVAFSVTELQDLVDGYIDVMEVADGVVVFDADGAENNKLYNKVASDMVRECNPEWTGFISGNAVLCAKRMIRVD